MKRTGEQTLCGSVSSLKRIEVIVENLTQKRVGVHIFTLPMIIARQTQILGILLVKKKLAKSLSPPVLVTFVHTHL